VACICAICETLSRSVLMTPMRPSIGAGEGEAAGEARNPGAEEDDEENPDVEEDDEEGETHGVTQGTCQCTRDGVGGARFRVVAEDERGMWSPVSAERGSVKGDGVGVCAEVGLSEDVGVDARVAEKGVARGVDVSTDAGAAVFAAVGNVDAVEGA
jgi:hypothetical protein